MTKEELKQEFSNLYEKRKSFYEKHKDLAEKIGFSRWQKNEFFKYFYEGTKELKKENAELKARLENIRYYLDNEIPHELINEATTIIYKMV